MVGGGNPQPLVHIAGRYREQHEQYEQPAAQHDHARQHEAADPENDLRLPPSLPAMPVVHLLYTFHEHRWPHWPRGQRRAAVSRRGRGGDEIAAAEGPRGISVLYDCAGRVGTWPTLGYTVNNGSNFSSSPMTGRPTFPRSVAALTTPSPLS